MPLPVYILGPTDPGQLVCYPDLAGCEIAENIIYLGRQGCFTTKEGLKVCLRCVRLILSLLVLQVAYLSGVQAEDSLTAKSHNYTAASLQSLEATLRWDDPRLVSSVLISTSQMAGRDFYRHLHQFLYVPSTIIHYCCRFQGVDILLTSDWPRGISNLTTKPGNVDDLTVGRQRLSLVRYNELVLLE